MRDHESKENLYRREKGPEPLYRGDMFDTICKVSGKEAEKKW